MEDPCKGLEGDALDICEEHMRQDLLGGRKAPVEDPCKGLEGDALDICEEHMRQDLLGGRKASRTKRSTKRSSKRTTKRSTKRSKKVLSTSELPMKELRKKLKKEKLATTLTLPSKSATTESVVVRKPKKSKKGKKKQSAYNKFFKKMNKEIRADNPGMKQAQIMQLVAKEWNAQK